MERLRSFFYRDDYSDPTEDDEIKGIPVTALWLHAEMYVLGDKYQASGLSRLAIKKYEQILERHWALQDFLRSLITIYELTPSSNRELRNAALGHTRSNIKRFQSDDTVRTRFKETGQAVPQFTLDLLQLYIDVPLKGRCLQCGPNQPIESLQSKRLTCGKGGASSVK